MTSNEPPSPVRNRSRSPPPAASLTEAVAAAADIARRTCPVCLRLFDNPKAMWGHSWVHRERKERIHSTAPPPPPPPPLPARDSAAGTSAWHPWKIDSKEDRDRTCPKCAKMFNSPKAMFGHLHVHHERSQSKKEKGEGSSSRKPVAKPRVVVQIERPVIVIPNREESKKEKDVEASDSHSPVSIDLNRPVFTEEEMDGDGDSDSDSSPSIDLNKMPPGC